MDQILIMLKIQRLLDYIQPLSQTSFFFVQCRFRFMVHDGTLLEIRSHIFSSCLLPELWWCQCSDRSGPVLLTAWPRVHPPPLMSPSPALSRPPANHSPRGSLTGPATPLARPQSVWGHGQWCSGTVDHSSGPSWLLHPHHPLQTCSKGSNQY